MLLKSFDINVEVNALNSRAIPLSDPPHHTNGCPASVLPLTRRSFLSLDPQASLGALYMARKASVQSSSHLSKIPAPSRLPLLLRCCGDLLILDPIHAACTSRSLWLVDSTSRRRVVVDEDSNTSAWGVQLDLGSFGKSSLSVGQCPVKPRCLALGQATFLPRLIAGAQLGPGTWNWQRSLWERTQVSMTVSPVDV